MNLLKVITNHTKSLCDDQQIEFFNKYNAVHLEESEELIRRKFRKILSQEYELERMGDFAKELHKLEAQNVVLLRENNAIKKNTTHLFVTINPKESVSLATFMKRCHKIAKKTCFDSSLYVFEQRGTIEGCDVGKGFHFHMLAKRNVNYKPCKCCDNIRNSCKGLVGNPKSQNHLNIQIIGSEFAVDKKNYITGAKTGQNKDHKQEADVVWRTAESIDAYYGAV